MGDFAQGPPSCRREALIGSHAATDRISVLQTRTDWLGSTSTPELGGALDVVGVPCAPSLERRLLSAACSRPYPPCRPRQRPTALPASTTVSGPSSGASTTSARSTDSLPCGRTPVCRAPPT